MSGELACCWDSGVSSWGLHSLAQCYLCPGQTAGKPEWASIGDIDVPLRQRMLSHTIDKASHADLLSMAPDTRSKALALFSAIRHAGDWLNAVPSRTLGLHLRDQEFRLCLQYWLGLTISAGGTLCPICQVAPDPFGDHQVGCGGNGDRILQHDSIRDAVFSAAQSTALVPRKEVPSLILGTLSRPADIFLPNWQRGQPAALDVTVISTLQQSTLLGAASTRVMPQWLVLRGSFPLMRWPAVLLALRSFLWWSCPLAAGATRQQTPSPRLGAVRVNT